jgi:periplasmic divalent cation tolerance protein
MVGRLCAGHDRIHILFNMRIYYVTLNTDDEARQISRALLERQLAVCTNWFPITCAYRWEGKITEEAETVLIVKTQPGYRSALEEVIRQHINYTNLIAEIAPESVNESFLTWLNTEVTTSPPPKKITV